MSRNWRQSWTVSASQISPHLHISNSLPHSAHTGNLYLSNLIWRTTGLKTTFLKLHKKWPNFAQFLIKNPNISMPSPFTPPHPVPLSSARSSRWVIWWWVWGKNWELSFHTHHRLGFDVLFRTGRGRAAIYQRPPDLELRQWWCKLVGLDTSVFTDSVLLYLCLIVYTRHLLLWFCQNDIEESANRTAASQYF